VLGLIAPTDFEWFQKLASIPNVDEVNFWQPAGHRPLKSLKPGDPFFFKLKKPHDAVGGFGTFVRTCPAPALFAWEAFGEKNGVSSHDELVARCKKYRGKLKMPPLEPGEDPEIGCVLIVQPVFFKPDEWIAQPNDWKPTTISPTYYDLAKGEGARIWEECIRRGVAFHDLETEAPRRGSPRLIEPRLGQGAFRVSVMDAYGSACSITEEHSLPALEAAHIKPFALGGPHSVRNGLLFRADIHRLFDAGYATVTREGIFRVSPRLKKDWSNGRSYYPLDGKKLAIPLKAADGPDAELLEWHSSTVFKPTGT
jgi:putative restriction endonuclease